MWEGLSDTAAAPLGGSTGLESCYNAAQRAEVRQYGTRLQGDVGEARP